MPRIAAPTVAEHRDMRRASLLAAARDLLREGGSSALTMGALASATGLSRPTVYEYFPSTDAVIAAPGRRGDAHLARADRPRPRERR